MRLTKISFNGYKRLLDTGCNVDGKLLAFVGPNEAGKSTILEGLTWLTEGQQLPSYERTRNEGIDNDTEVVTARFFLTQDDLAAIDHLPFKDPPHVFVLTRTAGGDRRTGAYPKVVINSDVYKRFETLRFDIRRLIKNLPDIVSTEMQQPLTSIVSTLEGMEQAKTADHAKGMRSVLLNLGDALASLQSAVDSDDSLAEISEAIENTKALQTVADMDLDGEIRKILLSRAPEFILFSESDRTLRTSYDLADEQIRTAPPRAIVNILQVAGMSIGMLFDAIQSGDTTRLKSLVRRVNLKLGETLQSSWRQSTLSLEIDTDGTQLQILINENDTAGTTTAIQERSEGLRAFVALLCFLAVHNTGRPTILLIDEAETHLHIDAQADLIRMLTRQELVDQVIYTTHSPACLPTDLGSGIRLVEPCPEKLGTSRLMSNFWQKNLPGFNPLLLAMGASAAAFSVCREAVLCEGPSEMILLPSLLREAAEVEPVSFQVAPGLSLVSKGEIDFRDLASNLAYLVDGDNGGQERKKMLLKSGIPEERIVSLSQGYALEDLIDRGAYIKVVATLLRESDHRETMPNVQSAAGDGTASRNLELWAKENHVKLPSKVAVASRLAREMTSETISPEGRRELKQIYTQIMIALDAS